MPKSDLGHELTDKELAKLEKRIASIYGEAAKELQKDIDEYFAQFEERDKKMKSLIGTIQNGKEWTEKDYKQWRLNQIGRGKRLEALKDKLANRMTDANEVAVAYTNDATPGIYSLNRNYSAYTIEQVSPSADFTLFDEQTVKRLIVEDPDLMPYYPKKRALKRGIDLAYGKKQITASITSGILQGKSIKHIADDLQTRLVDMNRASAIRTARTAVTGAENAGRMDTYKAAEEMGIELQKEWLATLDNRTRHAHGVLDGQRVAPDKPFKVDGYEIMFPGDTSAPGYLVYNCRCTVVAAVKDAEEFDEGRLTYSQWIEQKKAENPEKFDAYMKAGKNYQSDKRQYAEYKSILGKSAPKTFADFQDMKYNDADGWTTLKTIKRQTAVVKNAECVTTPKKYTGYFLKEGAKHADQFFDVGYTADNPLQLRYDMAKQFDMSKAVDIIENDDGSTRFNIYMKLGVSKERTFCTGWRIDKPGDTPRIVTAFRNEKGNKNAK